jgi:hypothetical protein
MDPLRMPAKGKSVHRGSGDWQNLTKNHAPVSDPWLANIIHIFQQIERPKPALRGAAINHNRPAKISFWSRS